MQASWVEFHSGTKASVKPGGGGTLPLTIRAASAERSAYGIPPRLLAWMPLHLQVACHELLDGEFLPPFHPMSERYYFRLIDHPEILGPDTISAIRSHTTGLRDR